MTPFSNAWRLIALSFVVLLSTYSVPSSAQIIDDAASLLGNNAGLSAIQSLAGRQSFSRSSALEGAINPDTYVVGPGDVFSVSIGGVLAREVSAVVSADGFLVIPTMGAVQAANRLLRDVTEDSRALLQSRNTNVDVWVSLTTPRDFLVHVTGAVNFPGRYHSSAVGRLSDVVEAASSEFVDSSQPVQQRRERESKLQDGFLPSWRSISIVSRDGARRSFDLASYYATGDVVHNPTLVDGDVITIPTYQVDREAVRVTGEIAYPGSYAYREGDRLLDLLRLSVRPGGLSSLEDVRVTRVQDGNSSSWITNVKQVLDAPTTDVELRPGDHVDVLQKDVAFAAIYGYVKYPGTYEISPGVTNINELIATAGGLTDDANLRAAYVERKRPTLVRGDASVSDLDFFGRTFYRASAARNRLAVNVESEIQNPDFTLQNGDTVVFPKEEQTVFVTGNVPEGGFVPFAAGQPASYYLDRVGGLLPGTKSVYTFEMATGKYRTGGGAAVGPGDTIFADRNPIGETPELQALLVSQESARRQSRLMSIQTVISGVTAVAAIVTTVVAIRNN